LGSRRAARSALAGIARGAKPHALAVAILSLVTVLFFWPVLFGGDWLPNGGGDLAVFLWPIYSFAAHTLKSGQLPLWNPHLYSGAPFWADNQTSVLYPPLLLMMLLTDVPYQALEAAVMFHVWLAGVAMYVCLYFLNTNPNRPVPVDQPWYRELGARTPELLGAILWMLSDGFVTHLGNLNLIAAAAWLPLVMLGAWRALHDLDWRWALLGGGAWGLTLLAGHAQIAYFTALLIAAIGAWWAADRLWHAARAKPPQPLSHFAKTVGLAALIMLLGLGLSAGSWLPALEMAAQTGRAGLSYAEAAKFSLPPRALIGLIAPWVYGRGPAAFTGNWDRVEVGYIGLIGLALSLAGAWQAVRRRSSLGIFLTILGGLAFGVALGRYFPLHRLAYEVLPGFKNFRAPARLILLMNFAQSMLAASALRSLIVRYHEGGWLQGRGVRLALPALLIALAASELIAFGGAVEIDPTDPRTGFEHPQAVAWLAAQPDQPFRIDSAPSGAWQSDLAALHGAPLYDIYGVSNPLTLASYEGYYWSVGFRGSPTYNFLGARYVISDGPPPGDASFQPVAQFADGLTIYQNSHALPMAMLVTRAIPVETQARASDLAHAPDWAPWAVVYVEGGPPLDSDSPSRGSVTYTEYGPNHIALNVEMSSPAYLVLSEVYYPGWVAAVDGQPAPIYRANAAFRAIYLAEVGPHRVTLDFRPPLTPIGLAISGATLVVLAVVLMLRRRKSPVKDDLLGD
jgi:Bacterial membrane protein YfhO